MIKRLDVDSSWVRNDRDLVYRSRWDHRLPWGPMTTGHYPLDHPWGCMCTKSWGWKHRVTPVRLPCFLLAERMVWSRSLQPTVDGSSDPSCSWASLGRPWLPCPLSKMKMQGKAVISAEPTFPQWKAALGDQRNLVTVIWSWRSHTDFQRQPVDFSLSLCPTIA